MDIMSNHKGEWCILNAFFVLLRDKDGFYILILRYILPEHSFSRNDVLLKQCFNGVLTTLK